MDATCETDQAADQLGGDFHGMEDVEPNEKFAVASLTPVPNTPAPQLSFSKMMRWILFIFRTYNTYSMSRRPSKFEANVMHFPGERARGRVTVGCAPLW